MKVVESGLGRLGPLGVATPPDQHAPTADGDGRVSLPIRGCEVRLQATEGSDPRCEMLPALCYLGYVELIGIA